MRSAAMDLACVKASSKTVPGLKWTQSAKPKRTAGSPTPKPSSSKTPRPPSPAPSPKTLPPLPAVPQAHITIEDLSKKAAAGTITGPEAHQLANARRAIARKGLDNLGPVTPNPTDQQRRARAHFQAILDASPYTTDLPPSPPPGYDPEAANAYIDWYPPYGDKPIHPPDSADALALTDSEIKAGMERMRAKGHAVFLHSGAVLKGQITDRVEHWVDPITQTPEDSEHRNHDHRCGPHATQFTSDRAMVHSLNVIEKSTEYNDAKRVAMAGNRPSFVVKGIALESALGHDYKQHVTGRSILGYASDPLNPLHVDDTDQSGGTLFTQFTRDMGPPPGPFYLNTMYAKPK